MSFGTTAQNPERARARLDLAQRAAPAARRARELASLRVTAQRHRAESVILAGRAKRLRTMGETGMSQSPYVQADADRHRKSAAEASARAQELGGWA